MNAVLELQLPALNLSAIAPVLVVLGGAALGVLLEALVPRRHRWESQVVMTVATLMGGIGVAAYNAIINKPMEGSQEQMPILQAGMLAYTIWLILLGLALLAVLLFAERKLYGGGSAFVSSAATLPGSSEEQVAIRAGFTHSEVFPLLLFSLAGMMIFPLTFDWVTMFVALEVMSLPLYLLTALASRRRLLSKEAGLKYFLLGAMSSAIFLFGIALVYGYVGAMDFISVRKATMRIWGNPEAFYQDPRYLLLALGIAMITVGVLFKIGAVPFHSWVPDVYQGAPTPVTAFMATCTKAAAILAALRLFWFVLPGLGVAWRWVLVVAAVLTMIVGTVVALVQSDIKRMLAYSSIAHAGFMIMGIAAINTENHFVEGRVDIISATLFYLIAYGLASIGAFAILTMVRNQTGEANDLESWRGLGRRRPFLAVAMTIFLLSFAGIPLTAGFIGKLTMFSWAWQGGFGWMVMIAVAMSLAAAGFYLKVVAIMFSEPNDEQPLAPAQASLLTWVPLVVGLLATVLCGIYPTPLLDALIFIVSR